MQNSIKNGFTLIESMVGTALLGLVLSATLSLNSIMVAGSTNTKSQAGAQSLREALRLILSDPNQCSLNLDTSVAFNASTASASSATHGLPLKVTLADGTVIDGNHPGPLSNYAVTLKRLTLQTNGTAVALAGISDPEYAANTRVYGGDVYLSLQKSVGTAIASPTGGTDFAPQLVTSLMLTVETKTGKILRCYSPDPCYVLGSPLNANSSPSCNFCGQAGSVWVGNEPYTGEGGDPICLPSCAPGQFLVSDGNGYADCAP